MPTAAATGRNRVATNVRDDGDLRDRPGAQDRRDRAGCAASRPRRRSAPPRASASRPCRRCPENATRITSIQTPEKIDAQRVARPGRDVERGLADRAAHRLAAEEAGGDVADALGDEVPVRVRRRRRGSAPTRRPRRPGRARSPPPRARRRAGSERDSREVGQVRERDAARDRRRRPRPARRVARRDDHARVGTTRATSGRDGGQPGAREHAPAARARRSAVSSDAESIRLGWVTTSSALASATAPVARRRRSGPGAGRRRCSTATPVRKPIITE